MDASLQKLREWLAAARAPLALTGAGMSAESGIPTFRDADHGLWSRFDPMTMASPEGWHSDPALVWGWYQWRRAQVRAALPNAGHATLARLGIPIVTQNVDDLHERAGSRSVTHLHGALFDSRCDRCDLPVEVDVPDALRTAPLLRLEPPGCQACSGRVRPGVVWFGEALPTTAWEQAVRHIDSCDLVLLIGTSGLVQPAASLPQLAHRRGVRVVEINPLASVLSAGADLCVRGTAAQVLPQVASC